MQADLECYYCVMEKSEKILNQYQVEVPVKMQVMKRVFRVLAEAKEGESAPLLMSKVMALLEESVSIADAYELPKKKYNEVLLKKESQIRQNILETEDCLLAGLRYALIGNYIDFGAVDTVEEEKLNELLEKYEDIEIDNEEYQRLRTDLQKAKKLVYIADNAGEIVLDKVLIKTMQQIYPSLQITVIVRGAPILNDATEEDAAAVGLYDNAEVIANGTSIPGTQLDQISLEAKKAILQADLCIAKGQGNFETLYGCGLNIYYLFLCKCKLFVKRFQVKQFANVLLHD